MRRKHRRGYQGRFTRLASRYRSLFTLVWTFLAFLSVPGFNGSAHAQSATYRVTFEGKFTIAPSPDWFVGVSGLSLLDAQGDWLASHSADLFPYDAGTEEGTEFSLSNADTSPRGAITSIKGTGKFSNEPIATLTFTRQAVAPEITSATTFPVHEATTAVATLTAEDQDTAETDLTWSIPTAGGADAGQFTLSADGDLAFAAAPDYENPVDADGDNVYEVTVQVSDGTNPATADIEVTVVNVDEAGSVSLFPALLQVRTVVRPTLSDPDGGISAVAWQWARSSDKMTWADIDRAVRADYLPTDSDQGQYLRATASYTDGEGTDKTAVAASEAMVGKREPGPELSVKTLVSGLKHPWGIAFLPDETMLFGERDEKLMVRLTDGTVRDLTADLSDRNLDHNNGLMGIVVDPDFTTNRRFYTCMSHTGSVVQVIVWELDATYTTATRVVDPLVDGIPSGRGHNGCRLRFGPDGYLWISTGDTEVIGTTPQDLDSLGGKVLRVNAAGVPPADNPFSDSPVYSYGHRNPQGLALRPGTRQMWVVEHGPDWDDEINLLASGANYGWEPVPTNEMGEPQAGYDDTRPMTDLLKFPSAVEARWSSGYPTIATSGAIFLEGERWGIWEGRLAVATLKNRSLHLFEFSEDGNVLSHVIPPELDHTHDRLRTPMLGPDDALYISTSNGRHRDLILRLTPQQAPEFASDTAAFDFEVPENTDGTTPVATVEATDYNHDELTYTLGGTDVKSFYILDENIGELRVPSTTQLDFETKRTYEVTVTATDDQNTSDTVTLTIEVTDVEHEGKVTLSSTQPRVDSPFQASLSDPDGGVTATTWKWERSDDGVTGWEDIDGARSASYTPVADDAGKYLRATVTYTNTHGPGKTAQSVTSSAVGAAPNSNPEFPSASLVRRVAEHTAAGQPFDSPVEADDADSDPLQYALSGMDADLFDIDSSTGQLLTKAALDYEVANEYEVVVSVSDGKDTNDVPDDNERDDSVTVPIKVINVDEPGSVSLFPSRLRVRTVVRATLTDPDGDLSAVSWRWAESSDKTNWTNIDGATEADYLPTEATQGKYLRAKATSYGDGEGSGKTAQTESNAVVGEREPAPELITVVSFVSGLSVPWGMTFAPDGTMLFTERGGRLSSRLTDGTVQPVSADFDDLLVSGEAGLMAIAADPAFAANRRFYTCQAHTGPEVQVIAWTFNDDTYTAATRVADPLVGNIPAASRHSGCRLRFGPQGYLWIATGDATVGTAPQDLNSLGGKVLRVDAATGAAAAGNPFGSRLYTYGHRNVQGLARRPGTNQMWSVEHGPRLDDEINLLSAGGNYGWDPVPGYDEGVPMTDLVKFPGAVEARWSSGNPTLATSGGIFLEGAQWGRWDGRLAVATLKGSSLRLFEFTDDGAFVSQVVVPELDGRYGRLRTPLLGPDGALYVTTSNGRGQDKILRVSGSRAPAFLTDTETRNVDENNDISTFVAKVLALDSDGDTLTYTLSGPDAESFSIPDAAVGAMWANVAFDYETKRSYEVTVTATDPQGLNDSTTLTITVTDTDEPPAVPGAPTVSAKAGTTDSLDVIWTAPANAGKPGIKSYDLQYRKGEIGGWTDGPQDQTTTRATITGLEASSSYHVRVRATNDEGDSPWSVAGTGQTDAPRAVISIEITSNPGSDRTYAAGDEIEVTVTFSETVEVEGTPQLRLRVGSKNRTAGYLRGSGAAALVFSYEVALRDEDTDGVSIAAGRIDLNGGTIKDEADNDAVLDHEVVAPQAGHKVDGVRPAFLSAAVDGSSLTLTYGEALDGGSRPAPGDFTVEVAGTGRSVSAVSVSGSVVTLTLDPAVEHGNTGIRVNYSPGTRPIRDAVGNDARPLTNRAVENNTRDTTAPVITTTSPILVPENETAVATLNATDDNTPIDQLTWTIPFGTNGGADADRFALSDAGALSFKAAKDYEIPDDADGDRTYEVTVQVSDGDNSVAADLLVTLENVLELTPLTGPPMVDYPENKALRVAAYIASSEEDREGLDWILSGADANRFSIGNPGGVLRFDIDPIAPDVFLQLPDFEDPADSNTDNVYSVTLAASDGTDTVTLDVSVTVGDENEAGTLSLDSPRPRFGETLTASVTDPDGDVSAITWKWERSAGRNAWVVIDGTTAASYTPTAADTGAYLRVTADYTDSHAADQSARAVSAEVVAAELLNELSVTTNASTANPDRWAMRPEFSADILHYAVGCTATDPGDTMTLAFAAANAGTRVAVNGEQADDQDATVEVPVEGDSDSEVRITLATGSTGTSTTYVVHCMDSRNPAIERTIKEPGASTELITVYAQIGSSRHDISATYLAIIDANGVPRWQRRLNTRATHFKAHPDGKYPYSYGHYRPSTYSYRMVILDENLDEVERVTTTGALQHTGAHDFAIRENGNYVFEAYEPATRDFSAYTDEDDNPYGTSEATEDSVIEEVNPAGDRVFFWNSWDHMYLNDCLQHRFPIDYAHINSVQVVDDADIIASFRGCSQVWRIDRETETGEWLLGRSNRSDAEWEARGIQRLKIVGDPEGEFCGQHSARLIPNGHLLLFDNDHHCLEDPETGETQRPNLEFSRVVEYALDLDNGEAVFVRQHCLGNICDRISASQGHIHRMDSGHWLVSWGRGPSYNFPDASVTEVDPLTNEELLAFKITHPGYNAGADVAQPTRAYPVEFVALADTPGPLTAEIVESPATSVFHLGPTDAPKVVLAFNQPVVDPDPAATTWPWVSVQGATVTSISAHTVPGDPANAYLFTLTPAGVGPITFALVAGQSCASGGICTAAGTVLSAVPATAHTIAWVDTVAPALAAANGAAVNGATLTLTFDEALASANTAASAFAVTGGTTRTISGVSVNGTAVQLAIDPPILYGESGIEVDYTTPSRQALADAAGNKVASFEDRAVSNETPATTLSTGVSLSLDTASVSEGGSAKSVALTAMLNRSARPAATAVTVEVGTTGDTATEGTDYAAVDDLTLTIPAYTTGITVRFTLTPMNDRIDELGESLTVTGSTTVAGLSVTPPGGLALDIEDNDAAPSLALSVNASTINEDGGTAAVTVSTGSGSTFATAQTVRLAVAGTATEASDYTVSVKTLTLPAGSGTNASMVSATVTGLDDNLDDDDETIEITGSRNGVAFGSRQTIAIEDDDWPELTVTFRQADYRVAEGAHVDLPVTLSAAPERQVTIPIGIEVAGGAEAVDYSVSPASLTFGASETDKTLRVRASNDGAVDPGEGVTLSFGTTLPERISEGGIAETTVAIRDTDFTFAPAFAAGSGTTESDTDVYAVSEASRALRLSLRLETPRGARVVDIADPVVVSLATRENAGSRETDEDYATQRRSGTFGDYGQYSRDLSFAPADFSDDAACGCARARKAVSVDIFDDRLRERVEVFGLRLSRKSRRLSVPSKDITAKIAEDDAEPALTLDANPARIAEAGGVSTVTVSTGAGSTFPSAQTIRLELGGTATRGADYTIDSTSLTLPAGMGEDPSTVTTTVRALDDPFDDNAETVALSATRDGVEFAGRAVAIADDDIGSTRVDLAVNPAQVREDAGATTVRVTATLDGAAREEDTDVAVTVGASGDSAVEGTDYATVPDLTLTIDAGETTAETTFRLDPANDSAVEGARTITVDGSAPGLAVRSADLTLNDDDVESTTVTLTLDPLEVGENAGSRAVRVTGTLDGGARPTATVVAVTVGSGGDSAAEGEDYAEIPELELTIPANRTDGTVTFALRPTNDRTAEGTETISVRGDVAGLTVMPAELALADDDEPSTRLDLSLSPSTVSEAAAPTEVAVTASLDAGARTSDTAVTVTVGASADSATEGLDYAYISVLAITVRANETAGQTTFTLSPENDAIAEGAETISVTGRAIGLTVAPAALTLSDNDRASRVVTLSADPELVSEDAPADVTVTASLDAGARAEDTGVRLTVGAAGDTAVPGTDYERVPERTLTILSGETSGTATFRLEPLDNDSADGARTLSVTGSTTVAELRIEPASGAKVALEDDDNPAVLVTPDTLTVVEAESGTYAVALQTRPTADVTVTITGVSGDLSLDRTSLVFAGADWSDPQEVKVTAADDADSARDPDVTLTHRASGAAEYRGLRAELVVSIRENDPSLVFSETALAVPEGETATYTVALATVPTADVTVRITGASGDLSLDKTELAYTPGDWDDAQTITVEAAEDDDTSTDPAVTLTHEASGGGYDGVVGTVRATIREDDGDPRPPPPPPPGPGPGPSPPPSNRPPVATEEMTARILEVGDTVELDASEHFRDPDRRRMSFEAESADSAVATVEVDDSAVAVRAADHGITTVTVTAVDDRRARATQSFEVTVGRLVSFASEEVAAAEGETATLTVAISRPRDAATSLDYVVGPDDDPTTADADADDHDGMAGTVVIAAGATEATIAIAVRDDDDIEPPRETFAVTLRRSAEQARDFGLGVAAVRVRIDEGVCDRTPQVRNALRRSLPCARVSESDLAGVRTLDLSDTGLAALRPADFSGLDNLRALDMSGNSLASLPDGVFAGLGALSEARSQDNPGSPFVLRVELARTDGPASAPSPARLATRVRQGAPFPLRAGLKAVGGALSDASVVATGMMESAPISVARTSAGATRVQLASTPSVPDTRCGRFGRYLCYRGFATAIGAPLVLFKDPPEVRGSVPATDLAAENDSMRISLSELFVAVDGRPLRYAARSSDPGLAGAEVRGGVLIVVSGEDGREGTATITVTATDADGLSAELTFEVTLESMPRGFMRGWRRALVEGIIE